MAAPTGPQTFAWRSSPKIPLDFKLWPRRTDAAARSANAAGGVPSALVPSAPFGLTMPLVYRYAFPAMWLSWVVYWWAASRDVKSTLRRESLPSQLSHIAPLAIAVLLFSARKVPIALLGERFLPLTEWPFWLGSLLTAAGLLFTVWARLHLGRNWSGTVTIKEGHELVTRGPYALVRHPIYTGLLLAFLGSALALGDWRGVLAFALAAWALWLKLQVEERWMRQQFGAAYQAYSERVAALIPFVL